jgi:hypothetical protein
VTTGDDDDGVVNSKVIQRISNNEKMGVVDLNAFENCVCMLMRLELHINR